MSVVNIVPIPLRTVIRTGEFTLPSEGSIMPYVKKRIDKNIIGDETYVLEVTQQGFFLSASSNCGLFRGWQSVKQLVNTAKDGKIPCMKIEDRPRFAYRAFMIDSARHMQTIDEIKRMIDAAAFFKFNIFHWHLSDDQGFRMQIDRYPRLMEIGSVRHASNFGKSRIDEPYGGYYTKEEMREIVRYCAERFIDVVPELDMPGHTTSLIASYPGLSCAGVQIPLRTTAGVFPEILCAGKEEVYDFAFGILEEMLEIFPSKYIHIGGDETPKINWRHCPICQMKISEEALANEEELQGYFVNRIQDFLRDRGRTAICWNESLKSHMLDCDIVAQMWMDKEGDSIDWANNGGNIIMSDFFHYYTDYPYAMTSLNKTYRYEPIAEGIRPEAEANVLGVSTPIWTEYIENEEKMHYMTYPRFAAVAESGWSYSELKDRADFVLRMRRLVPALKAMGINSAPPAEWNPAPLKKISGTVGFFAGNFSKEAISSLVELKKNK